MGAKWQRIRSILNPRMLKPKHVQSYTNAINEVVTDFVDRVEWLRGTDSRGVMVNDLAGELYKFAFEGQQRTSVSSSNHSNYTATLSILFYLSLTLVTPVNLICHFSQLQFFSKKSVGISATYLSLFQVCVTLN